MLTVVLMKTVAALICVFLTSLASAALVPQDLGFYQMDVDVQKVNKPSQCSLNVCFAKCL